MDLFGLNIPSPISTPPVTTVQRLENKLKKEADRYAKAVAKQKPHVVNLQAFRHTQSGSVFIGQQIYIKPNYIVSIPEYCYFNRDTGEIMDTKPQFTTQAFVDNQANLADNDRKGKLSRKAVQGLRNSINWLCLAAKRKRVYVKKTDKTFTFKVNFITLTLPDTEKPIRSSELQKELLNPFLVYMRQYQGLKNYVWRLEFQANGKLHVHITTDCFLHLKVIRDQWNGLLKKRGYLNDFYKKYNHYDPNSTDVHATKSIKNIAGYLAKYMSKKNSFYKPAQKSKGIKLRPMAWKAWYKQRLNFWNSPLNPRPITGRIWSCNYELSQANKCQVHVPSPDCSKELAPLMDKEIRYKPIYSVINDKMKNLYTEGSIQLQPRKIGEVYFLKAKDWIERMTGVIRKTFDDTRFMVGSLVNNYEIFELN